MRIIGTLVEDCPKGFDCPRIYTTDGAELVVQGYVISDEHVLAELDLDEGQSAVRVSQELVDRAVELGVDVSWLLVHASDDPVVVGTTINPADVMLSRLLPVGERIVVPVRRPTEVAT